VSDIQNKGGKQGGEAEWRRQRYIVDRSIVDSTSTDISTKQGKETRMYMRRKEERREHTRF
jgi:hypothetical protein